MFANYVKIRKMLEVYQHGLVEFNPETQRFEKVAQFPERGRPIPAIFPAAIRSCISDHGVEYVYYASALSPGPGPGRPRAAHATRVVRGVHLPAARHDGGRSSSSTAAPDGVAALRLEDGTRSSCRRNSRTKLIASGRIKPDEALLNLRDIDTGKTVLAHGGSVYWNAYRGRWVMIAVESFGSTSFLGEVWYAEADTPLGPWVYARKIVTHDKYSFYNPKQHPMFDKDGGRIIFFEGTYTTTFSGNPTRPRGTTTTR